MLVLLLLSFLSFFFSYVYIVKVRLGHPAAPLMEIYGSVVCVISLTFLSCVVSIQKIHDYVRVLSKKLYSSVRLFFYSIFFLSLPCKSCFIFGAEMTD